jgi:hypothetical protein
MIFCARATRGLRRPSLDARSIEESGCALVERIVQAGMDPAYLDVTDRVIVNL